jgi:predicted enzyme related to lactoylglutathione lyase
MTRLVAIALLGLMVPLAGCVTASAPAMPARTSEMATPAVARPADPPIFVRSFRLAATDPETVAGFYKAAFGMHEIRRITGQGFIEIVLNSGATVEAARANPRAPIVLMTRPKDLQVGAMAGVILNVADMSSAIASVKAAGGTVFREPQKTQSGASYAFIKDPEGNQIELLTAG